MVTILVVEDEEFELLRYEKTLTDEGYRVLSARDGFEALDMIKQHHPDLVVLDIKLPGIDGIETLGKIIDEQLNVPIVIHTAFSVWRENFRTRFADAYVMKSKDMIELKTKISEILKSIGKLNRKKGGATG